MRQHGTRACYVFGPEPGSDRTKGCRCDRCRQACADYARERYRKAHRPDETLEAAYVDNAEAREHLAWLRTQGVGYRTVAVRTGMSRTTITKIGSGTVTRSRRATIDEILAVGKSAAHGRALVDAGPTWRRIDDLLAHGWTRAGIASALGYRTPALQLDRDRITATNAETIRAFYDSVMWRVDRDREIARDAKRKYREAA